MKTWLNLNLEQESRHKHFTGSEANPKQKQAKNCSYDLLFWNRQTFISTVHPTNEACATKALRKAHGLCLRQSSHYLSIFPKRRTFLFSFAAFLIEENFPSSSEKKSEFATFKAFTGRKFS